MYVPKKIPKLWLVGVAEIDKQHQSLVDILNQCLVRHNGKLNGGCDCLDVFLRQLEKHFRYEENHMNKNGFPKLDAHRKHHQEILKSLKEEDLAVYSQDVIADRSLEYIVKDMEQHDSLYGSFLQKKRET